MSAPALALERSPAAVLETELRARGPFSLAQSAGHPDPTRRYAGGLLELLLDAGGPARARVWQRHDGVLGVRLEAASAEPAMERLRFVLALEADHAPFLRLAARDPLLAPLVRRRPGFRPLPLATPEHALLRAVAGQLVAWSVGRDVERAVVVRACAPCAGRRLPPTAPALGRLSPAELERCGLSPRRAATLARVVRRGLLGRLGRLDTPALVRAITAEPGLGPWSAGVVAIYGFGRAEHGLVGDLGLVRLAGALPGGEATVEASAALLERYGEWAGLASVHLLGHPLARRRGLPGRRGRL